MVEEGTVVAVEGRRVRVRMKPGPECARGCACATLGGDRELDVESDNPPTTGARVLVRLGPDRPWLGAVLLFVLPLAGLVSGVVVGAQAGMGDAAALALGFGMLAALFALAAAIDRSVLRKRVRPPTIVEVLNDQTHT